ncbi:hypothetical protein [Solibacillus silvestris]|uniref:hypothetical protein n=1 Tax=Solibacillus silvestris TaxID=76853 RepID=UPI000303E702|nr:hypothetical protein [Solibacillus silvestris]
MGKIKRGLLLEQTFDILENFHLILEDLVRVFENRDDLFEEVQNILENRKFIRTNKNILEHLELY